MNLGCCGLLRENVLSPFVTFVSYVIVTDIVILHNKRNSDMYSLMEKKSVNYSHLLNLMGYCVSIYLALFAL